MNLKQPEWKNTAERVHAPVDGKMGMSLCGIPTGRSWTVTTAAVTCRRCKQLTDGGFYAEIHSGVVRSVVKK